MYLLSEVVTLSLSLTCGGVTMCNRDLDEGRVGETGGGMVLPRGGGAYNTA